MVEELRRQLKELDEERTKAQEKYLEVYNAYHLKRAELKFRGCLNRSEDNSYESFRPFLASESGLKLF